MAPAVPSPTGPDLVGAVVQRVRADRLLAPLEVLVDVVVEQCDGIAAMIALDNESRARVVHWAAGSAWTTPTLEALFEVAVLSTDELQAPAEHALTGGRIPSALQPILHGREQAAVAVVPIEEREDAAVHGWLLVVGDAAEHVEELRRAAETASLLASLLGRADLLSGSVLLAQVEASSRRDEVETSQRLVDGVGAALGHEVRDALRNVMGWARLASASDIGDGVRIEMVRKIQRAAGQAAASVGDALEMVREGQSERFEHSLVDLNGVMKWVTDVLGQQIEVSRATVEADLLPTVMASPTTVRMALLELVRNSLEHAGRFVHVLVSADVFENEVQIRVRDNGPGLDEDGRENAFHPGYSTGVGTGYGLNRVSEGVGMAGGRVWFEDAPEGGVPNRGVTVVISLPHQSNQSVHSS